MYPDLSNLAYKKTPSVAGKLCQDPHPTHEHVRVARERTLVWVPHPTYRPILVQIACIAITAVCGVGLVVALLTTESDIQTPSKHNNVLPSINDRVWTYMWIYCEPTSLVVESVHHSNISSHRSDSRALCWDPTRNATWLLWNDLATNAAFRVAYARNTALRLRVASLESCSCENCEQACNGYHVVEAYETRDRKRAVVLTEHHTSFTLRSQEQQHRTPLAHTVHPNLKDSGRSYDGIRLLRLCSVLVVGTDLHGNKRVPEYAGTSANARLSWTLDQHRWIDAEYQHSSYGKLGVDLKASSAVEVDVGYLWGKNPRFSDCYEWVFQNSKAAFDKLSMSNYDFTGVDAMLYYLPKELMEVLDLCKASIGLCTLGVLYDNDPTKRQWVIDRDDWRWRYGCAAWYQPPTYISKASVMAHELGHYLGLHHAGGVGYRYTGSPSNTAPVSEYGNTAATMGADGGELNSFTAPARYFLGVLHDHAVTTLAYGIVSLQALSKPVSGSNTKMYSALVLQCSYCRSRNPYHQDEQAGGELWITFRGDHETCTTYSTSDLSQFHCHRDYYIRHSRVLIHFRIGSQFYVKTEEWYWLGEDEGWNVGEHAIGIAIHVCAVNYESDVAHVAVANTANEVVSLCQHDVHRRNVSEEYNRSYDYPPITPPPTPVPNPPPAQYTFPPQSPMVPPPFSANAGASTVWPFVVAGVATVAVVLVVLLVAYAQRTW